ncbi:transcriptional regulator [Amycolatopsis cihanbeyliensis]|uniref:Thiaminase n=1 Tax=Amycolatopsis cihanbeyliensis TaxID=1128664 RepID=A0A542CSE3_AMYCI|nr:transcriptional regulator [Amycolatopsis cihanbeyliensis]TQI93748.1 thiaminase [Amycolatopsis cihanbeyliensis]
MDVADASTDARQLYRDVVEELTPAAGHNRFLTLLEAGQAPRDRLRRVAAEQDRILRSDRRSFTLAAARFAEPPAGPLLLDLAAGESRALELLHGFAGALGLDSAGLRAIEPTGMAQAYPHHVAWLCAYGTAAELLTAMVVNLGFWGSYCARTAVALREHYGLTRGDVEFFEFFSTPPPGFVETALEVVQAGFDQGSDPRAAATAARHMQVYEAAFWDSFREPEPA